MHRWMQFHLRTLLLLVSAGCVALGGWRLSVEYWRPQVHLTTPRLDVGQIPLGTAIVTRSVLFENRGRAALRIGPAATFCLTNIHPYHDMEIPPGGTGRFEIAINTRRFREAKTFETWVTFHSNDSRRSELRVDLAGEIIPEELGL
jgi:hypothetical protein